jgi:hypothetical protein
MCATEQAMESGICTNPVHAGIIADLDWDTIARPAPQQAHYSPIWCKNTHPLTHYFGAKTSLAPK